MDIFETQQQDISYPPAQENSFPDFSPQWIPPFEEDLSTRTGKNIEKSKDIVKKACGFIFAGLGLTALVIFLPTIVRILYGASRWLYELAETVFP